MYMGKHLLFILVFADIQKIHKVGQDLFGIYNETIVDGYADGYLLEKTSVHSDADHWIWLQDKNSKNYWKISFAEIGKTVFLTREKAEKALKEMEGK